MLGYLAYLSALYCFLIFYVFRRSKSRKVDTMTALDLGILIMIFGFWGARLMHVFYENPEIYSEDWKRVFYFWYGGFVFYGGALAAFFACLFLIWKKKLSFYEWADFYAPVIALGYGLGRLSCLIAGCCYGRACEAPWAIQGRHPTQAYAALWELATYGFLIFQERRHQPRPGQIFGFWLCFHGVGRIMMEHYRDDFRGSFFAGQSISTWISVALLTGGVVILLSSLGRKKSLGM
jgi:phosphatidylglycerol:prolipoprotein diacylglycerol transferase